MIFKYFRLCKSDISLEEFLVHDQSTDVSLLVHADQRVKQFIAQRYTKRCILTCHSLVNTWPVGLYRAVSAAE